MQTHNCTHTMKFHLLHTFVPLALCAGLVSAGDASYVQPRRATPLLITPPGFPELPSITQAQESASGVGLNLSNVQGDILVGMMKNKELFFFFGISDATTFKAKLRSDILPRITTTTQILSNDTQPTTALNIAFSHRGLLALNVSLGNDTLGDPTAFGKGQLANIGALGDPGTTNWVPEFIGTKIHGVMLLASDTLDNINAELTSLKSTLGNSITEIYSLQGAARPNLPNRPMEEGHEHFGFLDGISNAALIGFQDPKPGQAVVPAGEILVGEANDTVSGRPDWAKDGSFLAFRQLKQLVPEFNKFLTDNPINAPGLTPQQGSDLLGARMIGRWKSGAPVMLAPRFDDPDLGGDKNHNNNFNYTEPGAADQSKCPFSAHIRKTRPRADIEQPGQPENESSNHHIIRGGIPYGPEVTDKEASSNTTQIERGLAFVAYQSNLNNGFQFLQQIWANNKDFVNPGTGFDPIIGANKGGPRPVSGLDPTNVNRNITLLTDFVVSRGGEYFFSPSLSALAGTLSAP
ncbi:fungal peroxidase [Mycena crocata]|nr:fungal peroxidase [Mycena crocata]